MLRGAEDRAGRRLNQAVDLETSDGAAACHPEQLLEWRAWPAAVCSAASMARRSASLTPAPNTMTRSTAACGATAGSIALSKSGRRLGTAAEQPSGGKTSEEHARNHALEYRARDESVTHRHPRAIVKSGALGPGCTVRPWPDGRFGSSVWRCCCPGVGCALRQGSCSSPSPAEPWSWAMPRAMPTRRRRP